MLCLVGSFLSLERSVWIGVVLGTGVAMLSTRGLRRYLVPVVAAATAAIAVSLALIPGLSTSVTPARQQQVDRLGPQEPRSGGPQHGRGQAPLRLRLGPLHEQSRDYFQQAFDYPLTATEAGVHNTPLNYAVDLGLVGMTLWLVGVVCGIGAALTTRGPPDLARWRVGLAAIAMAYLVVLNSVPPTAWLNRSIWLFAGVVYSGRYIASASSRPIAHGSQAGP